MAPPDSETGRIAVYGATGYTGRLVAAELARRKIPCVLSARDRRRLEAVRDQTGADALLRPASLDQPAALQVALDGCGALIDCAGPFTELGQPVLKAAIEAGVHYLDTTGEQPWMRRVFELYDDPAQRAGVAVVPAMGFDYLPGDLAAALAGESLDAETATIAYHVTGFDPSRGTARSALAMIGDDDVEWRDGEHRPASRSVGRGAFVFSGPMGRQLMLRYPAGEHVTVPRHLPVRDVHTALNASAFAPHPSLAPLMRPLMAALQRGVASPLRPAISALVDRLPEGPGTDRRGRARFLVECEARGRRGRRRAVVRGRDIYGFTAAATVEGALRLAADPDPPRGALAPAQAFEPRAMLAALAETGLTFSVEPAVGP